MNNFKKIKLLILDCDGVLTNGFICYDDNKIETKCFSARDGLGIMLAGIADIEVAIITGRESNVLRQRADDLKIVHLFQKIKNKKKTTEILLDKLNLSWENVAFIGDDWNDYPIVKRCGVSACPNDAADLYKDKVDFIMSKKGGYGAVREFIELILKKKGCYEEIINKYINILESV